jgi:hypothetical protein
MGDDFFQPVVNAEREDEEKVHQDGNISTPRVRAHALPSKRLNGLLQTGITSQDNFRHQETG